MACLGNRGGAMWEMWQCGLGWNLGNGRQRVLSLLSVLAIAKRVVLPGFSPFRKGNIPNSTSLSMRQNVQNEFMTTPDDIYSYSS